MFWHIFATKCVTGTTVLCSKFQASSVLFLVGCRSHCVVGQPMLCVIRNFLIWTISGTSFVAVGNRALCLVAIVFQRDSDFV